MKMMITIADPDPKVMGVVTIGVLLSIVSNVCSEVAIYNKWDVEVREVKLSQYYNQMFPLYCRGDTDALLRWEVPWEANKTGLVGLTDRGETLVISVEESRRPPISSDMSAGGGGGGTGDRSRDSGGGGGGSNVMGRLKGQYICRNTLLPSDYADVFLTAPYTIELEAESTQYVTKGHPANLSCTASFQDPRNSKNALAFKRSTPVAPSISPDSRLLNGDKYEVYPPSSGKWNGEWRLGLMVVDQSDSGLYYCVATYDEFEATAQAGFNVVVDEKPYFVRALPKTVEVLRGETVRVNCIAGGLPFPSYYWERTHVYGKIQSSDRVQIQDNGTLIIADVRVKDADQYECHAENRAGSIMQTTLLRVN
ncbi:hemicentin-1-like, partial [Convolutriloba macropyga]|uniref:hemicentin-1-like n=1 Tax=Convolutriloba macropyga TaxID=536237 RepID=UPI003F522B78